MEGTKARWHGGTEGAASASRDGETERRRDEVGEGELGVDGIIEIPLDEIPRPQPTANQGGLDRLADQVAVLAERLGGLDESHAWSANDTMARLAALEGMASGAASDIGGLKDRVGNFAERATGRLEALERSDRLRITDLQQLMARVDKIEEAAEELVLLHTVAMVDGTAMLGHKPVTHSEALAKFEASKGSISELNQSPPRSGETPGAVSGPPAPASGGFLSSDAAHAWLLARSEENVVGGLAEADCRRVAALEHLERELPGTGEVWARLLAVGRVLQMWHDDVPRHAYDARVAGLGLDALGYALLDGVEGRLREQWRAFEAGERVPELVRYVVDEDGGAA